MPLGKRVQALPGNELLCDLPLELDAVGTLSGHGFHPLKAQLTLSTHEPQTVRPQGRTPSRVTSVIKSFIARRHDPREEPGALAAHAGICAGGGEQSSSLPRQGSAGGLVKRMQSVESVKASAYESIRSRCVSSAGIESLICGVQRGHSTMRASALA